MAYMDAYVKCPYFCCNDKRKIVCEGITDGCKTVLSFSSGNKKRQHRSIFCESKYANCEIYRMLEKKYEE